MLFCILLIMLASFTTTLNLRFQKPQRLELPGDYIRCKFSPDEQFLMVTAPKHKGIYLYDLEGDSIIRVSSEYGAGYRPDFSEDGTKIAYKATSPNLYRLFLYDIPTGRKTELRPASNLIGQPVFTHDGYILVNYEGQLQKLTQQGKLVETIDHISSNIVVVTHSGKYLVYTSLSDRLWAYDLETEKKIALTPDSMRFFSPLSSPTEDKIVANRLGGNIYVIDVPSGKLRKIDRGDYYYFSPDGDWIFYTQTEDNGEYITKGELYCKSVLGDKARHLDLDFDGIILSSSYSEKWGIAFVDNKGAVYLASYRNK